MTIALTMMLFALAAGTAFGQVTAPSGPVQGTSFDVRWLEKACADSTFRNRLKDACHHQATIDQCNDGQTCRIETALEQVRGSGSIDQINRYFARLNTVLDGLSTFEPRCAEKLAAAEASGTSVPPNDWASCATAPSIVPIDRRAGKLRFFWQGTDGEGKPRVSSHLLRRSNDPFLVSRLPGLQSRELTELLIGSALQLWFRGELTAAPQTDPAAAQVAEFIKQTGVVGALADSLGNLGFRVAPPMLLADLEPDAPPRIVTLAVLKPAVPFERAELDVRHTITRGTDLREVTVKSLQTKLAKSFQNGTCERTLSDKLAEVVNQARMNLNDCKSAATDATCSKQTLGLIADATVSVGSGQPCTAHDIKEGLASFVRGQYTTLASQSVVTGTSKLSNVPRQWWTFGTIAGVLGPASFPEGRSRAKLNATGKISIDPLPRLLSAVVWNVHLPFEPTQSRPTAREAVRAFVGTSITPDPGMVGGIGVAIWRGLSLNAGGAWLFIDVPAPGETLDVADPKSPINQRDPFETRRAGAYFLGLGYSFGK